MLLADPNTLKRHLCTPTNRFNNNPRSINAQWFGPVALTLVEVETAGGEIGHGTVGGFTSSGTEIVDTYLKPHALGHSVYETELQWDKLYRGTVRFGRHGVALSALSAVDIACWDLKSKLLKQPVYNVLDGKVRDRVPAYCSRLYALEDVDALAEEARGYVKQGFRVLKQRFGVSPVDGADGMKRNVEVIRAVREGVGDDIELAADAYPHDWVVRPATKGRGKPGASCANWFRPGLGWRGFKCPVFRSVRPRNGRPLHFRSGSRPPVLLPGNARVAGRAHTNAYLCQSGGWDALVAFRQ